MPNSTVESPECVRCGYCCRKSACPYGEWSGSRCRYLVGELPGEYLCSIHDEIARDRRSSMSPAFGSGCSSPLFNADRKEAIRRRRKA